MQTDPTILLRLFFFLCFIGTIAAGIAVLKNYEVLFGKDPNAAGETAASVRMGKMQVLVVIAHALLLFGAFALLM